MAISKTTVRGPYFVAPGVKEAIYQVEFDNSYPAGGEPIDFTADFNHIFSISVGGNDTAADNNYLFQALLPAPATAITSTNVTIQAIWDPADSGAAEDLVEVTATTDLSTIGQLSLTVKGD